VTVDTRPWTPPDQALKVLLVEHDPMTREMLAAALEGLGYEVHTQPDGLGVERAARMFQPDIALIDMPAGSDCVTLARRLQTHGDIPLLFLTVAADVEGVMAAFEVGGDDYVVKPFVMSELVARMRAVLRRSNRTSPTILQVGDVCIDVASHTIVRSGRNVDLTQREFALLGMLCRRPGAVLSKSQLMAEVWGYEHYDLNVVEVHMSALRRKLEEHGPRLIHTVRGVGYVIRAATTA
jgi:two-component system OmpR family response regulator